MTRTCQPPNSWRPSTAAKPTTASGGFAPLDATGTQLLFRFVAAERRALGIGSHWAFNEWGRFLPEHTTPASLLDHLLHHAVVIVTDGDSYRMRTRGGGPAP